MYRMVCLVLVLLFLMVPVAFAKTVGDELGYQYTSDSDGVRNQSISYSSSTEDVEKPFSYTVNFTRYNQKNATSINEYSLIGQWRKELPKDQAWTVWAGAARNDLYTFMPAAVMYEKGISIKENMWIDYSRENIGTVEAYQAGIYMNTYSFSYLNRLNSKTNLTATVTRNSYTDDNQQNLAKLELESKISRQFKSVLIGSYNDADRANFGTYYTPLGEKILSIRPEYTMGIGQGYLTLSTTQGLLARNSTGHIRVYDYNINYQIGSFSTGYTYSKEDTYTSRTYKISHQTEW